MDVFAGLNPAQAEAVRSIEGPLLILAGAGSGKTKTLTHRIAHLIQDHGVSTDEILALTFTNKAAKEMRQRLATLLGRTNNWFFMTYMGTFHSICVKILRLSGGAIGIESNFIIYDEADRQHLMKQVLKQLGLKDQFKVRAAISIISGYKNQLRSVDDVQAEARTFKQRALADIYRRYEKLRHQTQALDFDDLLLETVRLLKSQPAIRRHWQEQFKFILIDEYQDTNAVQYQLIRLLLNQQQNICVVGDDWQSIYAFRHADFTNILNFKRDFPKAKEIKLEQNYRSTGNILAAAQSVIEKNLQRSDKRIWTEAAAGQPVQIMACSDDTDEANRVAHLIQHAVQRGYRLSDIAILYRTNAQSYPLERAFVRFKIPHKIIGGVRFFDRKEVKDVVAYLRLAYQPADLASFQRIVNLPARGLGKLSVDKFLQWQATSKYHLLLAIKHLDESPLAPAARRKFQAFGVIMDELRQSVLADHLPADLIEQVLDLTKYRQSIEPGGVEAEDRLVNLNVLIDEARLYGSLVSFLEDVSLVSSADQSMERDQVSLMTIHAAKGLEFPVVVITGLEEETFPHVRAFEKAADMEEERRLCYVAMTRAREELYMTHAQVRFGYGGRTFKRPSQFLADFDPAYQNQTSDLSVAAWSEADSLDLVNQFEIGDRVLSPQFGRGEIADVDGLAVTVRFTGGKLRKLNIEYANLQRLD